MPTPADRARIRALVERVDVEVLCDQLVRGLSAMPEYERFVGGAEADAVERGRAAIAWNVGTLARLLGAGEGPSRAELDRLGDLIDVRAAEGRPLEEGVAVYREGIRLAWDHLLGFADERERAALGGAVPELLELIDVITRLFADVYAQRRDALISQHERRARRLVQRIVSGAPPTSEESSLADMLGLSLAERYRPLAMSLPDGSMLRHIELAARLRAEGTIAATDGRLVVALQDADALTGPLPGAPGALVVLGEPTAGDGLEHVLSDLRHVSRMAAAGGREGCVDAGAYLPELLALRSPDLAADVERRVFGRLLGEDRGKLADTLCALAGHGFERARAAAAMPVHRNTLAHRLARVHELTGLDVDDPDDRGLIWLAARLRRMPA